MMEIQQEVAIPDVRFDTPIYTMAEAGQHLDVPYSTFRSWAKGYSVNRPDGSVTIGDPFLTVLSRRHGKASIPFVGLVEGTVAAAFRRAGVSLQQVRRALTVLNHEMGVEHALASNGLYTDGAKIIFDYADKTGEEELAVVVTGQGLFADIIRDYLERIHYATDSYADRLTLPITERPLVEVDPLRNFGRPRFIANGAPIAAALHRFKAGESPASVAKDFNLSVDDLWDVIRASLPTAA
jgi:uncharacterized protein (DUF433 family)